MVTLQAFITFDYLEGKLADWEYLGYSIPRDTYKATYLKHWIKQNVLLTAECKSCNTRLVGSLTCFDLVHKEELKSMTSYCVSTEQFKFFFDDFMQGLIFTPFKREDFVIYHTDVSAISYFTALLNANSFGSKEYSVLRNLLINSECCLLQGFPNMLQPTLTDNVSLDCHYLYEKDGKLSIVTGCFSEGSLLHELCNGDSVYFTNEALQQFKKSRHKVSDIVAVLLRILGHFCSADTMRRVFPNEPIKALQDLERTFDIKCRKEQNTIISLYSDRYKIPLFDCYSLYISPGDGYCSFRNDNVFSVQGSDYPDRFNPIMEIKTQREFAAAAYVLLLEATSLCVLIGDTANVSKLRGWLLYYEELTGKVDYNAPNPSYSSNGNSGMCSEQKSGLTGMSLFKAKSETRITADMKIIDAIMIMADDNGDGKHFNPGAALALNAIMEHPDIFAPAEPFTILLGLDTKQIYGSRLYYLIKYCCKGSLKEFALVNSLCSRGLLPLSAINSAIDEVSPIKLKHSWDDVGIIEPTEDYVLED